MHHRPTPYQYLPSPQKDILAVRVNRFTDDADYLLYTAWRHAHRVSATVVH